MAECNSFCLFSIFYNIHSFNNIYLHLLIACKLSGAEPRIELGRALQQADVLPTDLSHAAPYLYDIWFGKPKVKHHEYWLRQLWPLWNQLGASLLTVYKCTKKVTLKECFILLASAWLTFSNINLNMFIIKVFSSFIVHFPRPKYYRYVNVKKKYIFTCLHDVVMHAEAALCSV